MLNCRDVTRLVSEAQERRLPLRHRAMLGLHLMMCTGCRDFRRQIDLLRDLSRRFVKGQDEIGGDDPLSSGKSGR